MRGGGGAVGGKVLSRAEVVARYGTPRREQVVFTNGVFDLLHRGHLHCLEAAARLGDALVVGVNSDDSVRRLGKGPERPVTVQAERARAVASLACVDAVCVFDEETPHDLIDAVQPDVLVKGADYRDRHVVGREVVEARGGRVVLVPLLEGVSTTRILEQTRAAPARSGGQPPST